MSKDTSPGWTWILVAVLIVVLGWVGTAVYYEYQQVQQQEEAEAAATAAAEEAAGEAEVRQQERTDALGQRIDALEARVDELIDASEPTVPAEGEEEAP